MMTTPRPRAIRFDSIQRNTGFKVTAKSTEMRKSRNSGHKRNTIHRPRPLATTFKMVVIGT